MLNVEQLQALEAWQKKTGTKLRQINGQRKYGGPPEVWDGPIPGPRCEVFISHIPHDTYEDVLIPLFSSVGPLWEFRLMMNFSGQNRGFAYAKYGTAAVATEAIRLVNGYRLETGCHLNVCRSTEKKHLFIEDLPASTRQEGLLQALRFMSEGVERVSLRPGGGGVSAVVAFSSHHAASMAKKVLVEGFKKTFSLNVSLKWLSVDQSSPAKAPPLQNAPRSLRPAAPPPRLARSPRPPSGFCRAVGGPTAPLRAPPPSSSSSSQGGLVCAGSPVMLLRQLCEGSGLGRPVHEMFYSVGPYGWLHVTYKVYIPRMSAAFKGVCTIPPGPDPSSTQEEAEKAVAQQVLLRVFSKQPTV